MRVLAADVGGTKTAVAIVEIGARSLSVVREARYQSREHSGLEEILVHFLRPERRRPRFAGFGVAGPVQNGRAQITKLPWTLDERDLSRRFRGMSVRLVNDFAANALGLWYLKPRQVRALGRGKPERGGPIALIGAGTGLGEAGLLRVAGRYEPFPSEGGHTDFGPRDAREDRLGAFLRRRAGRSEWDRLLSGVGLQHIYDFLKADGAAAESPRVARALREEEDRAAVISRFGLEGRDPLCRETLALFVSLYGSEAGNVALQYRATGGLFIAGGIAPKILPALETGLFLESFRAKPPLENLLEKIPVRVVLEPRLGLFGAAAAAYRMAIDTTRPFSKTTVRRTTR
ncbi:MAG: glucokinase [Thermoanaerobaculia bacterium]